MADEKDFELIREFLNGSESAFNLIVKKYQEKIYIHARRMLGNHLDADEITQEVIITLYNKLSGFKFNSSLNTWIFKITRNKSINKINSNKIRRLFSLEDTENFIENNNEFVNIYKSIEDKEKLLSLDKVLQKLPAKQREVFILRNFDELSYEEISKITGKSTGALKANYFHALNKVTECMNEDDR